MRWCALLGLATLAGCLSWTQADPPPRSDWNHRGQACDTSRGPAAFAATLAVLAGSGAAVIFATTEPGKGVPGEDFEARMWGGLLVPIAIGYALDALNMLGDTGRCREYRALGG